MLVAGSLQLRCSWRTLARMFLVGDDKASIDYDLGLLREPTTSLDERLDAL